MAVADQERNEEIDERGKGTGEMMEPAWPRHTHDHNHHIELRLTALNVAHFPFAYIFYNRNFDFSSVPQTQTLSPP